MATDKLVALELLFRSLPMSLGELGLCFVPPVGLQWCEVSPTDRVSVITALASLPSLDNFEVQLALKAIGDAEPREFVSLLQRRIDAAGDQWRRDFEPLPMQWSSRPDLPKSSERDTLLDDIRAWIAARPSSTWRSGERGELFAFVAGEFDETVTGLIDEYLDEPNEDRLQAVAVMLCGAPHELVWNVEFVRRCLRAADRTSESSMRAIRNALYNTAFSIRHHMWVGDAKEHSHVRQQADTIAKPLLLGSVENQFYLDLSEAATQWDNWPARSEDAAPDRRDW